MTTVVWDGRYLCSDSLIGGGYKAQSPGQKIFNIQSKHIIAIGLAGSVEDFRPMIYWIVNGIENGSANRPDFDSDSDVDAIVVMKDGLPLMFNSKSLSYSPLSNRESIGSGCDFAMGALLAGKNSIESVRIASRLNFNTNSIIQCYDTVENKLYGPFTGEKIIDWVSKS